MDRNKIDRLDASSSTDIAKYAPAACIARGHLENKIFYVLRFLAFAGGDRKPQESLSKIESNFRCENSQFIETPRNIPSR